MLPQHLQDEINLEEQAQEMSPDDRENLFELGAEVPVNLGVNNGFLDEQSQPQTELPETMGEDDLFDDFKEVEIKINTDGMIRGENDLGTQEKLIEETYSNNSATKNSEFGVFSFQRSQEESSPVKSDTNQSPG